MDRNQITGLLIIFLMITVYLQFFAPKPEPNNTQGSDSLQVQTEEVEENLIPEEPPITELDSSQLAANYGEIFTPLVKGEGKKLTIENKDVKITFNSRGGVVEKVLLKNYQTHDKKPLVLIDKENSQMRLNVETKDGKNINLYQLLFKTEAKDIKIKPGKNATVKFRADIGPDQYIEQIYTIAGEGYVLDYDIKFKGLDKTLKKRSAKFSWQEGMRKQEKDLYYARYYATVNYATQEGDFDYLYWPSEEEQSESFKGKALQWFSFKQRFFSAAMIAENSNLQNAKLVSNTPIDTSTIKFVEAYASIPYADLSGDKANFKLYFGPNNYYELRSLNVDYFDKNVHLGWPLFAWIAKFVVIPLFSALEGAFSNYGIIIILMVLIIKTCLLPLTYKSYKSMAKMRVMNEFLQPELNKFKEENGIAGKSNFQLSTEEQQKVQKKQMELYQELGSSPFAAMSGCIPLLLQMPILLSLFLFFPNAIELRQESFLWASDLSTYDSIMNLPFKIPGYGSHVSLFTLLMTLSTIALTYFNNQNQATNMQGPMKYMGYVMPVVFMFVLNSYPSGLSFYYLVQNLVTIGQQSLIKKFFIDEDKIRAKFEDYKKKNKGKTSKKSSLVQRLEQAQKVQQEKIAARKQKQTDRKQKKRK